MECGDHLAFNDEYQMKSFLQKQQSSAMSWLDSEENGDTRNPTDEIPTSAR
jgi:hypothetical protein